MSGTYRCMGEFRRNEAGEERGKKVGPCGEEEELLVQQALEKSQPPGRPQPRSPHGLRRAGPRRRAGQGQLARRSTSLG